jgi:signal transduction histidine kinase
VAQILRELETLSEDRIQKDENVDINAVLADILKITRESFLRNSNVELHLDLESGTPSIMAEKYGIKQVFINLIQNAVEAMPEGGNLFIRTRHVSSPLGDHLAGYEGKYRGFVEITVSDDGVGIPEVIKSRLFEPFVSSKGGGHPGLGLSIVHNVIKALNGTITFEGGRDRGTVFKIELPIAANQKT